MQIILWQNRSEIEPDPIVLEPSLDGRLTDWQSLSGCCYDMLVSAPCAQMVLTSSGPA